MTRGGTLIVLMGVIAALRFSDAHADDGVDVARIVILPPTVEFLSMETEESIDAPKADTATVAALITQQLQTEFNNAGAAAILLDAATTQSALPDADPAGLFNYVRKSAGAEEGEAIATAINDLQPGSDVLIVRARFFLDYWGRSGRGWQVATSILSADRSDKRMVMDVRLYAADALTEIGRERAQERVTPRAAEKGVQKAANRIVESLMEKLETHSGRENHAN